MVVGVCIFSALQLLVNSAQNNNATLHFDETSESGVRVQASAKLGVLPAGTTMRLADSTSLIAKDVAGKVFSDNIHSAQGVDISFINAQGVEIEPNGYVNVSMKLANSLEGNDFALVHAPDNDIPEYVEKGTADGVDFAADQFSLYVLAGLGTEEDPYSTVYREYTIGFGESVTILSDERNYERFWIPGSYINNYPAWGAVDITGGNVDQLATLDRYRGTADVQPRLVVTAKNKTGTLRIHFRYTHPVDRTHKTVTGEFTASHFYLVHIVDKSSNSLNVTFRNNDNTGISHVKESDLEYTTEDNVKVDRTVSANYTHTFTIANDPSTRAEKVTLTMPEYPGNTTRTSQGKTYKFIGWSVHPDANPTSITSTFAPYQYPDAHVFAPGDKFILNRDVTLYAAWAMQDEMPAYFTVRIDDHIPNEPQSHGNASYIRIGGGSIQYKLTSALFKTDAVNGVDQGWDPSKRQKPWPARVFSDLKAAGKLPDDVTDVDEFKNRYRIVWSTVKKENDGWHVDGILYARSLYNLAYHTNGDLTVVSSMPEGVKDIPAGRSTPVDTRIPNRYDAAFVGWNTKTDGTGTLYLPGSTVTVSEHPELDTSINTLHLYAQWAKTTKYNYKVEYLEAETGKALETPTVYADQILENKIYSKDESKKITAEIPNYIFSYATPQTEGAQNYIAISDNNTKNVIKLYYMSMGQDILATAIFVKKIDENGKPLAGAEFQLVRQGDTTKTFTSDKNGAIHIPFTEDPGPNATDTYTYTLTESKAPDNYIRSDDSFSIEIKRGNPQVKTLLGGISKTVFPLEATVTNNGAVVDLDNIAVVNKLKTSPISLSVDPVQTGDNIITNILMLFISFMGVFVGVLLIRKRKV